MYRALLILITLLFGSQHISAQPRFAECNKPLTLSITNDWYPYVTFSRFDETSGIDVELLKAILEQMDCTLSVVRFPERRTLFELKIGNFDIGLGASKTPQRERKFYYSNAYRLERNRFVYREGDQAIATSKTLKSIIKRRKLIGVNLAGWYGDELERAKQSYNGFVFSETVVKRLEMLAKQRVDLVIDDEIVLCSEIVRQNHSHMRMHSLLLSQTGIHYIFNKQNISSSFVETFNETLNKVLESGELIALFAQYVSPSCTEYAS